MRTTQLKPLPLLALLALLAPAQAQDLDRLERQLKRVSKEAVAKTVLIQGELDAVRSGEGSGALISAEGHILTCSHVAELGQRRIVVTLSDGTSAVGKLLGYNKQQDFALVKIEVARQLDHFELGRSADLDPGDWVVALGHPGGRYPNLQPAVSFGRLRGSGNFPVQAMARLYKDALVHDAPLFSGNSGGPLVDLEGRLVGINGAIVQINDLGFAIPIEQIEAVLPRLKAGERIQGQTPTFNDARDMQALISPEDYQKLMEKMFGRFGDVFGDLKDTPFGDLNQIFEQLFGGELGQALEDMMKGLQGPPGGPGGPPPGMDGDMGRLMEDVMRAMQDPEVGLGKLFQELMGKTFEDLMKGLQGPGGPGGPGGGDLGKLFEDMLKGLQPPPRPGPGPRPLPNPRAEPRPLPRVQGYLGVTPAEEAAADGVLLGEITAGSPAAKAGLRRGDVILSVDGLPTRSRDALKQLITGRYSGEVLTIKVRRTVSDAGGLREVEREIPVTLGTRGL